MSEELYIRFVALLAAALTVPAVVFSIYSLTHRHMLFWRYAAAGTFFVCLASVLSAFRDVAPAILSTFGANALVGLGYFLCLRSSREITKFYSFQSFDKFILGGYLLLVFIVFAMMNYYHVRVVVVSFGIVCFSAMIGFVSLARREQLSGIGVLLLTIFASGNILIASGRGVSASGFFGDGVFSLSLWDPVFFIWSIAATLTYSLGIFVNGIFQITRAEENLLKLVWALLLREQDLSKKLSTSLNEQRDLQRLVLHELKRPINAIGAIAQTLNLQVEDSSKLHNAKLWRLSNDAASYLNGIAEYDEISQLFLLPNIGKIVLRELCEDIAIKWECRVDLDGRDAALEFFADPMLIDIALGNLIENAIKFSTNRKDIIVRIYANEAQIVFDISDGGYGIPVEEWDRVWDKFYKLESSKEIASMGCGLGLFVVRQIARLHGGDAIVVSQNPSIVRFSVSRGDHTNDDVVP